ncbi:MAG: transglycosylase SLT domain-containing protein [Acidiferrobacterales bacterium]
MRLFLRSAVALCLAGASVTAQADALFPYAPGVTVEGGPAAARTVMASYEPPVPAFGEASRFGMQSNMAPGVNTLIRMEAKASGVPWPVLWGVVREESRGWPWTIDVEGHAHTYADRAVMEQALKFWLGKGLTNVDVGLAQINWGWHGKAFDWNVAAAVDPIRNLRTAAHILYRDHAKLGGWGAAVAAYHGGAAAQQRRYAQGVLRFIEEVTH